MWIKICGIRDCGTARHIAQFDIDAIGLNFYHRSPRLVDVDTAEEISKIVPETVARVGVFVNHPIREIESIVRRCSLDQLQLHGDEPPSYLAELKRRLPKLLQVRAWRIGGDRLGSLADYLNECESWNCKPSACLVDAHVTGMFGGSGKKVPWKQLARDYNVADWPPLILAGGLNPSNISEAISTTHPWGVDVASGVESAPGVKNLDLVRQFIANARETGKS